MIRLSNKEVKEKAISIFWGNITKAWTYQLLTIDEKEALAYLIENMKYDKEQLKGTNWRNIYMTLLAIYNAFLGGCGCYSYKTSSWRQERKKEENGII